MFRAAYRSSSGALTVFAASGLHKHLVTGRSQVLTDSHLQSVTIPEAAYKQLRRRPPEDEQGNA